MLLQLGCIRCKIIIKTHPKVAEIAFQKRWVAIPVVFLGTALLAPAVGQTSQPPLTQSSHRKSPQSKSVKSPPTAPSPALRKAPSPHSATHASAHMLSASKSGAHTTLARTVRARNKSNRAHLTPTPSYQLHPDAERYQQIQQVLLDKGYFKGGIDGTWGGDSVDALKRFQADQNLPDDGKISALTLTALGLGPKHDGTNTNTSAGSAAPPVPVSTTPLSATSPSPTGPPASQPSQGPPE